MKIIKSPQRALILFTILNYYMLAMFCNYIFLPDVDANYLADYDFLIQLDIFHCLIFVINLLIILIAIQVNIDKVDKLTLISCFIYFFLTCFHAMLLLTSILNYNDESISMMFNFIHSLNDGFVGVIDGIMAIIFICCILNLENIS